LIKSWACFTSAEYIKIISYTQRELLELLRLILIIFAKRTNRRIVLSFPPTTETETATNSRLALIALNWLMSESEAYATLEIIYFICLSSVHKFFYFTSENL
jgi:hypothetical protein